MISIENKAVKIAIKIPSVCVFAKLSHDPFGLIYLSLKAVKLSEPAHDRRFCQDLLIPLSHGLQTQNDLFLCFQRSDISRDEMEPSDRNAYKLFDTLFFIHYTSLYLIILVIFLSSRVHWFLHSCPICSQCLYLTDKWIWQKNSVGKAIPQASQQFLPSFFTSITKGKAMRDTKNPTLVFVSS